MFSSLTGVCGISRGSQRGVREKEELKGIKVVHPMKRRLQRYCVSSLKYLKDSSGERMMKRFHLKPWIKDVSET